MFRICFVLVASSALVVACGDSPPSDAPAADASAQPDATTADGGGEPDAGPTLAVPEFGTDETRRIVAFASAADGLRRPRDLAFDPENPANLWVASRDNDGMLVMFDAGEEGQRSELFLDAFRDHFMEEVSSLAFGQPGTFGTCQESRNTYNNQAPPDDFMGPALWSSDLSVFAAVHQDPNGDMLGSHIDMLHQSPLCMGIEHLQNNEYFVFDAFNGHLVYYDFQEDHGPGFDDHSDGIVHRYADVVLTGVRDVPSHMVYDRDANLLYIADTGAARIVTFEVGSGTRIRELIPLNEPLADFAEYGNSTQDVFVSEGLERPSGIALHNGRLFVSDHGTGEIVAYDVATRAELGRLDTGAGQLMGITVSPDGRLWFVDAETDEVLRVDP